ncbi:MAG TPA: BPL-N domain-containing protein [Verrucomicrobiales bacterium]|nr:BPL-N domain-containing protein [Verrucomicrobiales bacterium]
MNRLSVFALLFAVAPALSHAGEASRKIKVVLYDDKGSAGEGVPRITAQLAVVPDVELVKLNAEQIRTVDWSDAKVIIFSGGSGSAQSKNLQDAGLEKVRTFVEKGGGYIGICAGAYLACGGFSWGVKVLDAKTVSPKYNRGKAQVEVEFTAKGQEITGLKAESKVNMLYANGPIYCPAKMDAIPDFEPLAFYRTEIAENGTPAGIMVNSPAMVAGQFGKGRVLCSSPHPEQTKGMEQWIGKAVRWAAGDSAAVVPAAK